MRPSAPVLRWAVAALLLAAPLAVGAQQPVRPASAVGGPMAATARLSALGVVRGRVFDAALAQPIAAASVTIEGNGELRVLRTALDGSFAFDGLPPGRYALSVARAAYLPSRVGVAITDGAAVVIDVELTRAPVALAPLVVRAARTSGALGRDDASSPDATLVLARRSVALLDPLGSPGGMLASLVGVATGRRPGDPGGGDRGRTLYIWGAREAGARVLVDGIPLGAPLHAGGLVPITDDALVGTGRLWSGGAPARLDGGTDYLMELRSRDAGDSLRVWGGVDMLGERAGAELPIGRRGSLMGGVRHVRDDALARWGRSDPGYGYADGLVRLQLPAAGGTMRMTTLASDERLQIPRDQGEDAARWGNVGGAVAWERAGASPILVRAAASRARIELPLLTLPNGFLRADAVRATFNAERRWFHRAGATSAGVDAEHLLIERVVGGDTGTTIPTTVAGDCAARCTFARREARAYGTAVAAFAEYQRPFARGLHLTVGGRVALLPQRDGALRARALPRVALEALPTGSTVLRLSAGRFSRLATAVDATGDSLPTVPGIPSLGVAGETWVTTTTASQVEVGGSQRWKQGVVGVVAWLQRPDGADPGVLTSVARGVDLSWQLAVGGSTIAASYSRVARRLVGWAGDTVGEGGRDRLEQLAALALSTRLGPVMGAVGASYAHGLSFGSIVLDRATATAANAGNAPADRLTQSASGNAAAPVPQQRSFLRVDATIGTRLCLGGDGCPLVLAPYARLLNALDRRDAIFFYRELPTRPVRGLGWTRALLSVGARVDVGRPR